MTGILIKREHTDTHRDEGQVKTDTESGVSPPQVRDHLGPPEAGRSKERFSPGFLS